MKFLVEIDIPDPIADDRDNIIRYMEHGIYDRIGSSGINYTDTDPDTLAEIRYYNLLRKVKIELTDPTGIDACEFCHHSCYFEDCEIFNGRS